MNAAWIGTIIVYIGIPTLAALELTEAGHRLRGWARVGGQLAEAVTLRVAIWVDRKLDELADWIEVSHIGIDAIHHGLLVGANHGAHG